MELDVGAWLLAHQGGWDEMLMVLAPLALFGGLLMLANRRAENIQPEDTDEADEADPTAIDTDLASQQPLSEGNHPDD